MRQRRCYVVRDLLNEARGKEHAASLHGIPCVDIHGIALARVEDEKALPVHNQLASSDKPANLSLSTVLTDNGPA
jgi:hypothetical protein